MRRNYIDTMKAEGLTEFISACDALRNCKFVIAETKISALLKAIADNKQLYSMFGAALYGFDYQTVFSECISDNGFSLPTEPKKAIALVFRLLLDIDEERIPLQNFLEAYFYSVSVNESYARFCLEVIVPFEKYCRTMFENASAADFGAEIMRTAGNKYRSSLKSDALNCVATLAEIGESMIENNFDRAEYTACLDGLTRALESNDYKNTISSFLGVKYAVAYFFRSAKTVQDVYKKLEYDIKNLPSDGNK